MCGIIAAGRGQVCARCGQVHLDQVGDVDRRDVRAARGDLRRAAAEQERVDQRAQLGVLGVLAEQHAVGLGTGAAV